MVPVVILDNGAHTIKAGLATEFNTPRWLIPNAAIRSKGDKRLYIGQEFEQCHDYSSLTYRLPFERGYLIDWDVQKAVWDNLFGSERMGLDLKNTSILITEPLFNLHSIQEKYDQLIFEEYEFESCVRCPAAGLMPYGALFASPLHPQASFPECSIIVDSGFSFTHVIPIMKGQILWAGVRRIDVGGKLLTNHLSNLVSFRQWNMLDQTHIVNDIKEKCCYVATTFKDDLEKSRLPGNNIALHYVLPDFSRNRHGYVRQPNIHKTASQSGQSGPDPSEPPHLEESEQILYMTNERFSVPELIFHPTDIGLSQVGVHCAVADSISSITEELQGMFWENIGLIGGNACLPNFSDRLRQELRALAPTEYNVEVYPSEEPIIETYKAAHAFANSSLYGNYTVSREEYNEGGSNACRRKFRQFDWNPIKKKPQTSTRSLRRDKNGAGGSGAAEVESGDDDDEVLDVKKVVKRPVPKREKAVVASKTKRDASRK